MNQLQFSIVCEAVTVYIVPHNMNLFIFIVVLLSTVWETSAQYYYVSAGQPALFQFRTNYNAFPQQFDTYHGNQQYSTFHGNQQFVRAQVPVTHSTYIGGSAASVPPVQRQNDVPEYRGFAYQTTTTDNNAVSHVLFVSGPESQKFTSSVFSTMTSPQNVEIEKARNIASDLVDPIKNTEYNSVGQDYILPKKIEKSFSNFFHSPGSFSSVVNFYSSPKAGLFARPVTGYPINTVPLQVPPTNSLFSVLGSNLETTVTTTSKSITANDDDTVVIDNAEAQESVMTNTRFSLNNFAGPKGKSLESFATDKVTEKNEFMEDISSSTEASTRSSIEFTGTTTPASELIVTETVKSTTMTENTGNTIGEPAETTVKSAPTTNESVEILDRSIQTSTQTVESTGQFGQIMDQSVQTTDEYVPTTVESISTTVQPISTTVQPISTTVQPISTTVQPISTTVQPISTTVQPISTTVQPISTTIQPISTTVQPTTTTLQPISTTVQPISTTEQSAQTTDQSAQTRDQSTETTGQSVTTTDQSVQTTVQSIQTTNQADQTSVITETTAANLDKIVTTEEIGTTARIVTTTIV